jgi:hypothetical protein
MPAQPERCLVAGQHARQLTLPGLAFAAPGRASRRLQGLPDAGAAVFFWWLLEPGVLAAPGR